MCHRNPGWTSIGDSPSAVLNDGTFLVGNTQGFGDQVALLDASTLTWTFGGGDRDNEQTYTLLQTGDVLTTGVYNPTSMRYNRSVNAFVPDAPLPVMLGATVSGSGETGPAITLMDGRVICFGATGHTCIYSPGGPGTNGTWVQGPDLPLNASGVQLVAADVPAILEPNGSVLLVAATNTEMAFVEYNPDLDLQGIGTFVIVPGAPNPPEFHSDDYENTKILLLPSGNGLVSLWSGDWYEVEFSSPDAVHFPAWRPTITSFPATVIANQTVTLAGLQLCGLSECASYGDDNQQVETYPMVRFLGSDGGVTYARAHDVSTRSIAPGEPGVVLVDIPASLLGDPCADISAQLEGLSPGDFSTGGAYEKARRGLLAELHACLEQAEQASSTFSVQVVAMGIPSVPVATVVFAERRA